MTTKLACGCPGEKGHSITPPPCDAPATQEDLLCDHCRTMRCWERNASDPFVLCVTLGCPEHTLPGSQAPVPF